MSTEKGPNFLEEIISEELAQNKFPNGIITRFPPEPNGYLHIGHAKSICLNFGLAKSYGGKTNLRFDDTNPVTEDTEYVQSIMDDVKWLGFEWSEVLYSSDYFEQLYGFAIKLIQKGKAYVDDSSALEIAALKGTPTEPGKPGPYRNRSVEENLDLFQRMRAGEFPDGAKVLRAKIDLASPNMHMRDPLMYRIKHAHHHRTGNDWCIYPMYDFAHGQCDAIEHITHSICTLEFEVHRPLYEWFIHELELYPSRQFEFARLNLNYTVMSKRKLLQLVNEHHVKGWDDPRMPTISGLRRRGYTPASIRHFCEKIGVARRENIIDFSLLEFCIREDLNKSAHRLMVVEDPIKLVINNFESDKVEWMHGEINPEDAKSGERKIPFSKYLLIEREDFMEHPPKKYFRLFPGGYVRLKHGYIVQCTGFDKDAEGNVITVYCDYFPNSRSGSDTSDIQAKGVLHWVSEPHAVPVTLHIYDRLFNVENPSAETDDFKSYLNKESLIMVPALAEPAVCDATHAHRYQFLRKGYFCLDKDSSENNLIFNRTVTLKDSFRKA